ncbi:hypothetical protein GCM10009117_22720 [Gangjinia marincola]|uniref:CarboxypepD_reg-like domain-containing protein n=1 Tax=Gangjinia marincola TaxID=578463 RepID=A0ABP3XUN5_9FLAO
MKYKLSIPEPCPETWNDMSPSSDGKFCLSCEKEVFDFTRLSVSEINQIISKNKNICAKINDIQLNQSYHRPMNAGLNLTGLLVGTFTLLALCQPLHAQSNPKEQEHITIDSLKTFNYSNTSKEDFIKIKGKVTSKDGLELPGVNIIVSELRKGVISNENGEFTFDIPLKAYEKNYKLTFSFQGFKTEHIDLKKRRIMYNLKMKEQIVVLGGLVVEKIKN